MSGNCGAIRARALLHGFEFGAATVEALASDAGVVYVGVTTH